MGWLLDLLLDLVLYFIPSAQDRRSTMGESRLDRQARIIGLVLLLVVLLVGVGIWWFTR